MDDKVTSILTNTSAMGALQTLRETGRSMADTQLQVSSGLRVKTAADNASYWAISTTMHSDTMAIGAVSDALGLGAAMIDTAYAGTEAVVDILKAFKARLVTATEDGVDKAKVQAELTQLSAQAASVVAASSFGGVNYLATTSADHLALTLPIESSVTSSFVRSENGTVSVKKMIVDLRTTSMLNEGGGGILQKGPPGISDVGGFLDANMVAGAHNGHELHNFTGPATFSATDYVEFSMTIDAYGADPGVTVTGLRIDKNVIDAALGTTDGIIANAVDMKMVLQEVFDLSAVPAWAVKPPLYTEFGSTNARFEIGTLETTSSIGSSIDIVGITSDFGGVHPSGFALGLEDTPVSNHDNMMPKGVMNFTKAFSVPDGAEILFDVQVNLGGTQTLTINKATVDAALGTSDGKVEDMDDFATLLAYVTAGTGVTAISNDFEYPNTIVFMADPALYPEAGLKAAHLTVGNARTTVPWSLSFDLAEVDVTTDTFSLATYLEGVEYMLDKATSSAAKLGALKTRIGLQNDFSTMLIANLDKGVGRLVDADMNLASSRLKALETRQKLATQSLSIANASAENILNLFR